MGPHVTGPYPAFVGLGAVVLFGLAYAKVVLLRKPSQKWHYDIRPKGEDVFTQNGRVSR